MKTIRIAALAALAALAAAAGLSCTPVKEEIKKDKVEAPPPPKEKTPKEIFEAGVAAFDQGKLEEANAAFSKAAEKVPANLVLQYDLGVTDERLGNLTDAQKHYEAANKLEPKHKPTLLNLGKVYRLQDKFDQAIALYEAAIKEPGNEYDVELNNNLTVALRLAKKFDKAEAVAKKVLARTKDNPDAYKNLALIYFDQGKFRLAEFISANAKKLDDKDPGVYNNLGLIYLKLDERRLALAQFQKAIAINASFAPGLFNIGAMALSYRDYAGAEKVFSQVTQLDPGSYESFLAYAWALDGQKGRDPKKGVAAGQAFERVLALKADQPDAICGAGWAYSADKAGWDKALGFLDKCKALPGTAATDQQLIDAKVKGILAMQKTGAPAAPPPAEKEKPKAAPAQGGSLLDKVTTDESAPPAAKEGDAAPAKDEKKDDKKDEKPKDAAPAPAPKT